MQPQPPTAARPAMPNKSRTYNQKALAEIRNSLLPFANTGEKNCNSSSASTISGFSFTSGVSSASSSNEQFSYLVSLGHHEDNVHRALKQSNGRLENALELLGETRYKLMRKPSMDSHRGSPAVDSGAGSSRSDSPRLVIPFSEPGGNHSPLGGGGGGGRQYSPVEAGASQPPPPVPPPRCVSSSPPPVPPPPDYRNQLHMKRASPRGASPVSLAQQMAYGLHINGGGGGNSSPSPGFSSSKPPPPYQSAVRSSPTAAVPGGGGQQAVARPMAAWGAARQATTPIIMQSVKSTQVQKPVLQTATAPPPPSYALRPQQQPPPTPPPYPKTPTTEPPSYAITMQALAAQRHPPPPTPATTDSPATAPRPSPREQPPLAAAALPPRDAAARDNSREKYDHESPIPERKRMSKEKEEERRTSKVKYYSPQAFKFYMEQHIENVMKSYQERLLRRRQLETEMSKVGLKSEDQNSMRKLLYQKESNYIRLKRAKMDKSMFTKIKVIGRGAFGEVALVRKIDAKHLYAMKTLRKTVVLERNQVAHVKAERDILAEADNEWVVKLYYSFQDKENLYFVMDYIAGGDLMSLLIKKGIFEEKLARFYIAELTCAVESVHKMGFIHRDIKPDNILIDKDGHIKLTDFGLCTGFRWTHNSKYYQRNGEHGRQDSMDHAEGWSNECRCTPLKPLERRRKRDHQRCLAHSLVGTPNYIAPEVLLRQGYTQLCDWWSVGVILYEMLVGQPPFLANTPEQTQYKVIHWKETLLIPEAAQLSPEASDLILKLCTSPEIRLGKNASEVKAHPYFRGIEFNKDFRSQQAPFVPHLDNPADTSNFDEIDTDNKMRSSCGGGSSDSDADLSKPFHGFFEFTFRRFFDDGGAGLAYPRLPPLKPSPDPDEQQQSQQQQSQPQGPVYV
ncbi:serine/threonine-protein kinase LATS1 isoform X2 [Cloeon dipterum]|uniref:serine/threonine-protein kinase LATS1 isoform X2 n=1 Tax=Cloeon dipterum TaxID=197152 RepID=UPI00321F79C2